MTAAPTKEPIEAMLARLAQMGAEHEARNVARLEEIITTGDTDAPAGALFHSVKYQDPTATNQHAHVLQLLALSWHGIVPKLSELSPGAVFVKPDILIESVMRGRTAGLAEDKHKAAIYELIGFTPPTTLNENALLNAPELKQLRRIMVGLRGIEDFAVLSDKLRAMAQPDSTFWISKIKDDNTALVYETATGVVIASMMHLLRSDPRILSELATRKIRVAEAKAAAEAAKAAAEAAKTETPAPTQPTAAPTFARQKDAVVHIPDQPNRPKRASAERNILEWARGIITGRRR